MKILLDLIRGASPHTHAPCRVSFRFVRIGLHPSTNDQLFGTIFRRLTVHTLSFDDKRRQCRKPQRWGMRNTTNNCRCSSVGVQERKSVVRVSHKKLGGQIRSYGGGELNLCKIFRALVLRNHHIQTIPSSGRTSSKIRPLQPQPREPVLLTRSSLPRPAAPL